MAATIKAASKSSAKRTSKAAAPPPTAQEIIDGLDFEPPRLTSGTRPVDAPRVPLFYIDDVEYSIMAKPRVNIALKFMDLNRTRGEYVATSYLLEKLLGVDGYQALLNYDDLEPDEFRRICEIAAQLALGALEAPKA